MIRTATSSDAEAICAIYNHYVIGSCITFEEEPVSEADMRERMEQTLAVLPWLVWEEEGSVLGYAHASKWKSRCAYRYAVESTIYLRENATGRGIGRKLYGELLAKLQVEKIHTVIGGIALPNSASQRLHEKLGFKKVAQFEQVGWKFNRWIDVGYWELIFSGALPLPG